MKLKSYDRILRSQRVQSRQKRVLKRPEQDRRPRERHVLLEHVTLFAALSAYDVGA